MPTHRAAAELSEIQMVPRWPLACWRWSTEPRPRRLRWSDPPHGAGTFAAMSFVSVTRRDAEAVPCKAGCRLRLGRGGILWLGAVSWHDEVIKMEALRRR